MSAPDPFTVLGIAPTLDRAELKRAYFRGLAQHPPHSDPEGFQSLRRAYEELSRPGVLATAYLQRPLDLSAELVPYAERFDAALHAAAAARQKEAERLVLVERFVDMTSRLNLTEALKKFSAAVPAGR